MDTLINADLITSHLQLPDIPDLGSGFSTIEFSLGRQFVIFVQLHPILSRLLSLIHVVVSKSFSVIGE